MTTRPLVVLLPFLFAACQSTPATTEPPPVKKTVVSSAPDAGPVAPITTTIPTVATAAPKPVKQAEKLAIKRIVLSHGVANKEPVDASTTFNAKESKIYAFVEVENPEKLPGEVLVSFEPPNGKPTADVKLAVGEGAHWRTWAFTRQAHEAGEWTAIVKDARGHELGRQTFNVEL